VVQFRTWAPSCFALTRFAGFASDKPATQDSIRSLGGGGPRWRQQSFEIADILRSQQQEKWIASS
jgi:hypothetical protein